jgi:hypothetical protein
MTPKSKNTGKNIFLHHETAVIVGVLAAALIVTISLFLFLWSFLQVGFVWLICFFIFFMIRKTNVWKFAIEIHFFMIFITTYVFGWFFSVSLFLVTLFVVVKFFRPDEMQGALINVFCLSIVTLCSAWAASYFGVGIATSTFIWVGTVIVGLGILLDYIIIMKMLPFMWLKHTMMHILEIFLQYYFISSFGVKILKFLFSVKSAAP